MSCVSAGFWNYFLTGGGSSLTNSQASGGVGYHVPLGTKTSATLYGTSGISGGRILPIGVQAGVNRQVGSSGNVGIYAGKTLNTLTNSIRKFFSFRR